MEIFRGSEFLKVDAHLKVFVARGTHNNYHFPGAHDPPVPYSPVYESIVEGGDYDIKGGGFLLFLIKAAVGLAIGGTAGGAPGAALGVIAGALAGLIEAALDPDGIRDDVHRAVEENLPPDQAPDERSYGLVLAGAVNPRTVWWTATHRSGGPAHTGQ
jgi:hypothetical protein